MKRALFILHAFAVAAALSGCVIIASDSIAYFGQEPHTITYSRSAVAMLCGPFAAAHLYLLASKKLTISAALLFYPLGLVLGLATEMVVKASGKGWAPASSSEAVIANVVGYGLITLLVFASAASCYWSIVSSQRLNA